MRPLPFRKTSPPPFGRSRFAMPGIGLCISAVLMLLGVELAARSGFFDKSKYFTRGAEKSQQTNSLLLAGNAIYEVLIEDRIDAGVGLYSIRTGPQHPVTDQFEGQSQDILAGASQGKTGTSYLTVRSYNSKRDYVQTEFAASEPGFSTVWLDRTFLGDNDDISNPRNFIDTLFSAGKMTGFRVTYPRLAMLDSNNVLIDDLEIVQIVNVHGRDFADSWVEVTTIVRNLSSKSAPIGIRYLWDLMIAGDDGPVVMLKPDGRLEHTEQSLSEIDFDFFVAQANDKINVDPPAYNVFGSVLTPKVFAPEPLQPTRLQHVSWPLAFLKAFTYQIDSTLNVTDEPDSTRPLTGGDNAIQYFWGETRDNAIVVPSQDSVQVTQALIATRDGERPGLLDFDPPACVLDIIHPGPPKSIEFVVQDAESGLRFIRTVQDFNVSVKVPRFEVGTTDPVRVVYTVVDPAQPFGFTLRAMDVSGNLANCDPIFLTLMPDLRIFEYRVEPIYSDRYFYIKNQGIERLAVELNGHSFTLSTIEPMDTRRNVFQMPNRGEMTIDIGRYLKESGNTMRLAFEGPSGSRADLIVSDMMMKTSVDLVLNLTAVPKKFALQQNMPNPFRGSTTIGFEVPDLLDDKQKVELKIYNLLGQLVRTLSEAELPAGKHQVAWDGRDEAGREVAAGVYVYNLSANGTTMTKKMTLLRTKRIP